MLRSRRSFAWSLVLALLCASFVAAQKPLVVGAVATTFTVNTTADDTDINVGDGICYTGNNNSAPTPAPACTLRAALLEANVAGSGSVVAFNIPNSDPGRDASDPNAITWTIVLLGDNPLPYITAGGITIDGISQSTNRGGKTNTFGPEIFVDGKYVTSAGGILLYSDGNTVVDLGIVNFAGLGTTGTGIEIVGSNNTARGNYIGLNKYGTAAQANAGPGIWIHAQGGSLTGQSNTIGGNSSSAYEYNIISGNGSDGILVQSPNNKIRGNYIGTARNGIGAVPNGGNGVYLRIGANDNIVGTDASPVNAVFRNLISGNKGYGIVVRDSTGNQLYGNWIGIDNTGDNVLSNKLGGIQVLGNGLPTTGNVIGGGNNFARNYIAGNIGPGLYISGSTATGVQITNNYIGLNYSGTIPITTTTNLPLKTQTYGVLIDRGAHANVIGGSTAIARNIISGNNGPGIQIMGDQPTLAFSNDNVIKGNYIGVDPSGSNAIANAGAGIAMNTNVYRTQIGGTATADANLIGYNGGDGIAISGSQVYTSTIQKNTIKNNVGNGISLSGARNTRIDGIDNTTPIQITNNGANGIKVTSSLTTTIQFNTIKSNLQNAVLVGGAASANTYIQSNTLNTNGQNGVQVDTQAFNTAITSNTIYTNTLNGVLVSGAGTQRVKIFDNSMQGNASANGKKGIVLSPGTTWPAPGNLATNPNHDIDPPYGPHIDQTGKLSGKIRLTPINPSTNACTQPCTIQVFTANPQTLDGQGRDKLNVTVPIVPDSTDPSFGNFSVAIGSVPAQLALTATDKDGNTSEFAVLTRAFGLDIQPPRFTNPAYPGQVITYTHRISNTGMVDFTNIQFTAFSKLGWSYKLAPANPITLLAGEGKPVTLTLTLPTGSAPNVRAGLIELTRLTVSATTSNPAVVTTASITDTTTVGGKFILDASYKLGRKGNGTPGTVIDYTRTMTNTGNVTGTVTLGAITDLGWTTTITPTSVQLPPGKAIGVASSVAIPQAATAGTIAKTRLTFNGTPDAQQLVITDTTTVLLTPKATMVFNQQAQGNAGKTVQFCHTVTNLSNGPATFTLTGVSSLGSKITFVSDMPGRQLVNGNTFTVGITDADKFFNFCANVLIDPHASKGQQDLVAIGLIDNQGAVVGGASVRDLIDVVGGLVLPRLYMPVIRR
jgi:CSLREA domain-containing protein